MIFIALDFLSPPSTSTSVRHFHFGPASSFFLELFLCSSPVEYWTPTNLEGSPFSVISFCLSYYPWSSLGKNTEVVCYSILQWTTFCQNSPLWPGHLVWPCTAWLIASLSYSRLWSMWSFWLAFCDCDFHSGGCGIIVLASSVCPLMDEDKRIVQASYHFMHFPMFLYQVYCCCC